ncbi:MAG: hypothetical protein F4Y26_19945 [Gammaproteobacteria bacterium]|nr:hypothetical protein [Gammaproteobacteria bacterium]
MPDPDDEDYFCRFVRPQDWSTENDRPKASAFKHRHNVSLWHEGRVLDHGDELSALQCGPLANTGQAFFQAGEIEQHARDVVANAEAKGNCDCSLSVAVEWRPETASECWKKWAHAHAEIIEAETNCRDLTVQFRRALCANARRLVAPKVGG